MRWRSVAAIPFFLIWANAAAAQSEAGAGLPAEPQARQVVEIQVPAGDAIQRLTLTDGSQLFGRIESIEADMVTFRSLAGVVLTVSRSDITDLRMVQGRVVRGEFQPIDPHHTRLLFAPTGRALRRGEGYVGVYYVLPFVQVGITDRLSVGGGSPLYFGSGDRPFWFTPKLQVVAREKAQVAAGVIHITGIDDFNAGIAYGVTTFGPAEKSGTVGLGYAYSGDDRAAIVMLGAELRTSRRIKWITENWIWRGGNGFLSGGVRFLGERLSADLSLVFPLVEDPVAFPLVSFAWSF
jgi:hypothetical protein